MPGAIVFSKTFLSFSKEQKIALNFLRNQKNNNLLNKVLFILEKDNNIDYNLSTHADIEKISFYPNEKEVLFFPFSSFEIKEIKKVNDKGENIYIIKLFYLGKYIKQLENNMDSKKIPDSEYKQQIIKSGLISKVEPVEDTPKNINKKYENYKKEINNYNDMNYILSEIEIKENDIYKDVRIINSYEEYCGKNKGPIYDIYKNENEIKNNIVIKIGETIIPFSYFHKFKEKGRYTIKYIFKNNLTNTNHMFSSSSSIIKIDLSNFNTKNVTNMWNMFYGCSSLKKIILTNFNTENVVYMVGMFKGCSLLTDINLSSFNTQKVISMNSMFAGCLSLANINLSNFSTQNIKDLGYMFYGCSYLQIVDLSNFNTQNGTLMNDMFGKCPYLRRDNIRTNDINIKNLIN